MGRFPYPGPDAVASAEEEKKSREERDDEMKQLKKSRTDTVRHMTTPASSDVVEDINRTCENGIDSAAGERTETQVGSQDLRQSRRKRHKKKRKKKESQRDSNLTDGGSPLPATASARATTETTGDNPEVEGQSHFNTSTTEDSEDVGDHGSLPSL